MIMTGSAATKVCAALDVLSETRLDVRISVVLIRDISRLTMTVCN